MVQDKKTDRRQKGQTTRTVENMGPVSEEEAKRVNGYEDKTVAEEKQEKLRKKGYDLEEATDTGAKKAE